MTSVQIGDLSTAGWIVFAGFASALVAGIVLGVWVLARPSGRRERETLDEQLARSEISPEEHRARTRALGISRRPAAIAAAAGLIVVGIIGAPVVAAVGPGGGFMRSMMGGMGSMMGGGEPGRSGSPPATSVPEKRITAREFSFNPRIVRLHVGQTVNIVFENDGHMFHTLTFVGLGLDLRANGDDRIAGSLTPDRAGTYAFICSVSGHADLGMRGQIVVTRA